MTTNGDKSTLTPLPVPAWFGPSTLPERQHPQSNLRKFGEIGENTPKRGGLAGRKAPGRFVGSGHAPTSRHQALILARPRTAPCPFGVTLPVPSRPHTPGTGAGSRAALSARELNSFPQMKIKKRAPKRPRHLCCQERAERLLNINTACNLHANYVECTTSP